MVSSNLNSKLFSFIVSDPTIYLCKCLPPPSSPSSTMGTDEYQPYLVHLKPVVLTCVDHKEK